MHDPTPTPRRKTPETTQTGVESAHEGAHASPETLIDIDRAHEILFAGIRPLPTCELPLPDALFRTLAEPVRCDVDFPPFDRSLMDGYAVRAADTTAAPVRLPVTGQVAAGAVPERPLGQGEAVQINTGAPILPGADAVVRLEDAELIEDGRTVEVHVAVEAGHFITPRATYVRAGEPVLEAGTVLTPAAIGAAAGAGAARVTVHRRPTVAILSTGNELIDIDRTPSGSQIRNSNRYQLEALVRSAWCEPAVIGAVGDDRKLLREAVERGAAYNVMCVTGGASVGPLDLVPAVLRECGARFHFSKLAIKPGRPVHCVTMPSGTFVFALPGNPVSAFVGFELLVRPALAALQGRPGSVPMMMRAVLRGRLPATRDRRSYLPARMRTAPDGAAVVEPLPWHGSGDLFGLGGANAMIMRPPRAPAAADGDSVEVFSLDRSA